MKAHMHMPGWMHLHGPNWHTVGSRMEHLIHDPRFWAGLALAVLMALMIATMILSKSDSSTAPVPQPYPYYPFAP